MKHAFWIVVALAVSAVPASAGDATKEDVIKLSKAGISDEVIFAFLKSRDTKLKLSAADVAELKKAEVSEAVIDFILEYAADPGSKDAAPKGVDKPTSPPRTYVPPDRPIRTRVYAAPNYYSYRSYPSTYYYWPPYYTPYYFYGHHYSSHYSYGHHSYGHFGGHYGGHHGGRHGHH